MKTPTAGHRRTPTQTVPTQPKGKFSKVPKLNEVISSLNSTCFCITNFGLSAIIQCNFCFWHSRFGMQKQVEFKEEITS